MESGRVTEVLLLGSLGPDGEARDVEDLAVEELLLSKVDSLAAVEALE